MLRRIVEYGKRMGLRVDVRHGDTSTKARQKMIECPPDVIITTPETFAILLTIKRMRNSLSFLELIFKQEWYRG